MARRPALEVAQERAAIERARLEADLAKRRRHELKRAYEAATATNYHPRRKEQRSPDAVMQAAGDRLRSIARYLDENHDLAIGVFDDLVNKIVGQGIQCDPMVRTSSGALAARTNEQIRRLWRDWTRARPDVSRSLPWGEVQRLVCRTWLRDGEVLNHHVMGLGAIRHRGPVPYSLEILEPDYLPFNLMRTVKADGTGRIVHGVEFNSWREPVAYHLTLEHPGDLYASIARLATDTKRVPASDLTHLKFCRRIGQARGVTILHGVLTRLEDLKEYDDSERIAARVASAFTAVITRGSDFQGPAAEVVQGASRRVLEMAPGMIFDGLLPGESVDTISSDRPNANYDPYRSANERAVAAGTGTSFSSISKRYEGSYSSQRQELVESEVIYAKLRDYLVEMFHADVYRRFLDLAELAGVLAVERNVDRSSLYDAEWMPPATSWIDPLKEVKADREAVTAGFTSRQMVIRKRGLNPTAVDQQIAADTYIPPAQPAPAPVPASQPAPAEDDQPLEAVA